MPDQPPFNHNQNSHDYHNHHYRHHNIYDNYDHGGPQYVYAGFWIRVAASIVDVIIFMIIGELLAAVLLLLGIDNDSPASEALGIITQGCITIWFWCHLQATPGKMLLGLKVLQAKTGEPLSVLASFLRYIGYFASAILLFLGFIWVAFDKKKQGFHDKIAESVVVKQLN